MTPLAKAHTWHTVARLRVAPSEMTMCPGEWGHQEEAAEAAFRMCPPCQARMPRSWRHTSTRCGLGWHPLPEGSGEPAWVPRRGCWGQAKRRGRAAARNWNRSRAGILAVEDHPTLEERKNSPSGSSPSSNRTARWHHASGRPCPTHARRVGADLCVCPVRLCVCPLTTRHVVNPDRECIGSRATAPPLRCSPARTRSDG